jgi:polar amino acid transport system substrate-binding protein
MGNTMSQKHQTLLRSLLSVTLLGVAACAAAQTASVLDRVKANQVVRIGIGNDSPPMNYVDERGQWVGFDVDLADAMAKKLGVRLERVQVNNKTRIAFLANNQIDMAISNISRTRRREQQIDFAEPPYLWTAKVFVARKGRFKHSAELGGKTVCVNQGSNAFTAAPDEIARVGGSKPTMVSMQRNADCLTALRQGKVDAFSQDAPIIAALAGVTMKDLEFVGQGYSPGLYSIGLPPDDSKWRDAVSFALQDLLAEGTYEQIYARWFGEQGLFPIGHDARPRLPSATFGKQWFVWPE